jgi:hypothetical protein
MDEQVYKNVTLHSLYVQEVMDQFDERGKLKSLEDQLDLCGLLRVKIVEVSFPCCKIMPSLVIDEEAVMSVRIL